MIVFFRIESDPDFAFPLSALICPIYIFYHKLYPITNGRVPMSTEQGNYYYYGLGNCLAKFCIFFFCRCLKCTYIHLMSKVSSSSSGVCHNICCLHLFVSNGKWFSKKKVKNFRLTWPPGTFRTRCVWEREKVKKWIENWIFNWCFLCFILILAYWLACFLLLSLSSFSPLEHI